MITRPKIWLIVSSTTMVMSLAVIFGIGFNKPVWGTDLTGGSLVEVTTGKSADTAAIATQVEQVLDADATAQTTQSGSTLIRTAPMSKEQHDKVIASLKEKKLIDNELSFESIGPTIGAEMRSKAWKAIALAVLVIIAYIAYEFRQAAGLIKSWKFGAAAIIALLHDLLFVTALFMIFGKLYGAPIDTLFITAMLAILGYSVNDTIVIFNRLKSEWMITRKGDLANIMDKAARVTLIRSLNTGMATLFTLIAILLFGGESIHWFVVALISGILVGTYSSIFVASPILYYLAQRKS